ncbi:MAG: hypothetical protein ACRDTC_04825 [Pseudonocardiaceae bacterium]
MPDRVPKPPPRLRVHVALCAFLVSGLIAGAAFLNSRYFLFFLPGPIKTDAIVELAARITMIVAALWIIFRIKVILVKRWTALDRTLSPGPPPESTNGLAKQQQDILDAIVLVRQRYSDEAIYLFGKMLSGYQVRVTERAELLGTSVRMCVSTEHAMTIDERDLLAASVLGHAGDTTPSIPVPVLKVTKGTLLDNLDVTDHADSSISVLSQKEARGLIALTLETLFYLTFAKAPSGSPEETNQIAALWSLRRLVSQTVRITTDSAATSDSDWEAPLREAFQRSIAKAESQSNVDLSLLPELEKFCCFFARNYVIAADLPIPSGVRFIVKYSKTVPLYGPTSAPDQRRIKLGLSPFKFWVPLNLAFTAESYHFRMDIGEAQFVADQYFVDSSGDILERDKLYELLAGSQLRIRDGSGLHYAHLYARGLHESEPIDLATVIKFEEAPPGALGATTIVAIISAFLVSLMTFISPGGGSGADSAAPNADTAALLFAVPLFAATLVGYSIDRVQRSSLATFGALVVTGTTALLGAVLFGLTPTLLSVRDVRIFDLFNVPSINIGGLIIAIVAIGNVVFLRWLLKYKRRRYLDMLQRWDKAHFGDRQQDEN